MIIHIVLTCVINYNYLPFSSFHLTSIFLILIFIEFFPAEGKFKGYLLAERVADYLKTREPREIEKADRLVRLALEE